jgi:hypothetical protein
MVKGLWGVEKLSNDGAVLAFGLAKSTVARVRRGQAQFDDRTATLARPAANKLFSSN